MSDTQSFSLQWFNKHGQPDAKHPIRLAEDEVVVVSEAIAALSSIKVCRVCGGEKTCIEVPGEAKHARRTGTPILASVSRNDTARASRASLIREATVGIARSPEVLVELTRVAAASQADLRDVVAHGLRFAVEAGAFTAGEGDAGRPS